MCITSMIQAFILNNPYLTGGMRFCYLMTGDVSQEFSGITERFSGYRIIFITNSQLHSPGIDLKLRLQSVQCFKTLLKVCICFHWALQFPPTSQKQVQ